MKYRALPHHEKTPLLNIALSRLIASLGHGDIIVIADAGLPVPKGVELIDLALTPGVPDLASTLQALLSEMQVQNHVLAHELLLAPCAALSSIEVHASKGRWARSVFSPMTLSKSFACRQKQLFAQANATLTAILP